MEIHLDSLYADFERQTLALALRRLADIPLEKLCSFIDQGGPRAKRLGRLTLSELRDVPPGLLSQHAVSSTSEVFDALMLRVLRETHPDKVQAAYLRELLGGPRWKLRSSLGRLERRGLVLRTGTTSNTFYRAVL